MKQELVFELTADMLIQMSPLEGAKLSKNARACNSFYGKEYINSEGCICFEASSEAKQKELNAYLIGYLTALGFNDKGQRSKT